MSLTLMKKQRSLYWWCGFIVSQTLCVIVLMELGLRLLAPYNHHVRLLSYRSDEIHRYNQIHSLEELIGKTSLGFRPFTNYKGFVLNSKSLRTPEFKDFKAPGSYRIVTLGDSFTFSSGGVPYEDMWTTLTGSYLAAASERDVEVVNLGIPGVGVQFALRMWELEGSRLDADLVLMALFVGNDFSDEQELWVSGPQAIRWVRHSYVLRLVRNLFRLRGVSKANPGNPSSDEPVDRQGGYVIDGYAETYDPLSPTFTVESFYELENRRAWICRNDKRSIFKAAIDSVVGTLKTFDRAVRNSGAELLVCIIPDQFQVDDTLFLNVVKESAGQIKPEDRYIPQEILVKRMQEEGILYLDLLPAFVEAGGDQPLFKLRDTHWNQAGNRLAAKLLAKELKSRIANQPASGM